MPFYIALSLLFVCACDSGADANLSRGAHETGSQFIIERADERLENLKSTCKRGIAKVEEYLSHLNQRTSSPNDKVLYWAGIAECALQRKDSNLHQNAIDFVILNSMQIEEATDVSKVLFDLADIGGVGIGDYCLLYFLSERLAGEGKASFPRLGEANTMNAMVCKNLTVERMKGMPR